jgi:hypothetical protein
MYVQAGWVVVYDKATRRREYGRREQGAGVVRAGKEAVRFAGGGR